MTMEATLPHPPSDLVHYTWRAARPEDAQAIYELLVDIEAFDQRGRAPSLEDCTRNFASPGTNVETDTLLALTPEGKIAGIAWIFSVPAGEQDYVAELNGEVHPQHRQKGLGSFLLSWMEARGREILATRPSELPHALRTHCLESLSDRVSLFEKHDFTPIRSFYHMRRDLSEPIPEVMLPGKIKLTAWQMELDAYAMEAFNSSFSDHWGFIPVNEEFWNLWFTGHQNFRADLSVLALAEDSSDENPVAGFSINIVKTEENELYNIKEGWIGDLGVRRAWRKQGLASAMLCASMRAFKDAGLDYAGLGVDTENLTGALRIYERLGFKIVKQFLNFTKPA